MFGTVLLLVAVSSVSPAASANGRSAEAAAPHDAANPATTDDSAARARRSDFDARERIACAQERGQPMGECTAGVARGDGGGATVVARFPNGFSRTLHFERGRFVSADATMSGSGSDIDRRRRGELHLIRVDDQRYELRDAFVFGP